MATTKKKNKSSKSKKDLITEASMDFDFSDRFDDAEKSTRLSCVEVTEKIDLNTTIHSGSLMLDLHVLGGGLQAGRVYDIQGKESGGKTTLGQMILAQAVKSIPNTPKAVYGDAEGTLDKLWFSNILESNDIHLTMNQIFGKRAKDGSWINKPNIRLIKPADGDSYLKLIIKYLNNSPDKIYHDDIWWYSWTPVDSKVAKKTGGATDTELRNMLKARSLVPDAKMFKTTGSFMVPVPNNYGGPEGLVLTDSVIALVPRQTAEDDSQAMSQHGRMFAKYLNNIKGLISRKGWTMININQLREKPAQAYGDPTYAPGGNTLHYIGDCRIRINPCANPSGGGQIEEEGDNKYRWTSIKNVKNKLFTPYREMKFRWWTQRDGVTGCGLDPVLDTLEYLEYTGQIEEEKRKYFYIRLKDDSKLAKLLWDVLFTQESFMEMLLTETLLITEKKKKKEDPSEKTVRVSLRSHCLKQLRSGLAFDLYNSQAEIEDDADVDDDDESDEE